MLQVTQICKSASFSFRNSFNNKSELLWSDTDFVKVKGKPHRKSNLFLCKKNIRNTALCTHHLIFFGGVSSSIPKLEHGGEVASVAAAASRKKKRLVGLWKVASECRGSLLRATIRLLVDGGCNAEAAVKHTGTTSQKPIGGYCRKTIPNFFSHLEIFCCWHLLKSAELLSLWNFDYSEFCSFEHIRIQTQYICQWKEIGP